MNSHGTAEWYHEEDISRTLAAANADESVYIENVVDVLAAREFDAPKERVQPLVKNAITSLPDTEARDAELADLESPRPQEPSLVTLAGVEYLGNRDMAILLGAVLSRFQGSFKTPADVDDVAPDLFWNRQHTTAALRVVSYSDGSKAGRNQVESLATGNTDPASGRSPSTLGIVSLTGFTEDARTAADEFDISLFGRGHLRQWLSDSRVTHQILGVLLEEGPHSPEEVHEHLDDLPALPNAVQNTDPFDVTRVEKDSTKVKGPDSGKSEPESVPESEEPAPPGQTGTLYADPSEDGDFGSFDRMVSDLESESEDYQ